MFTINNRVSIFSFLMVAVINGFRQIKVVLTAINKSVNPLSGCRGSRSVKFSYRRLLTLSYNHSQSPPLAEGEVHAVRTPPTND